MDPLCCREQFDFDELEKAKADITSSGEGGYYRVQRSRLSEQQLNGQRNGQGLARHGDTLVAFAG